MEVARASNSNGLVSGGGAVEEDGGRGRQSRTDGGGNGGMASGGRMRKKKRSRSLGRKFSGEEEIRKNRDAQKYFSIDGYTPG